MNLLRLIRQSLWHYRRIHLAVWLGVAAATTVLTGALLVGDSMRGSLRHLVLDRLGRIDQVLVTPRFFRAALADELRSAPGFDKHFTGVVPAVLLEGSVAAPERGRRANRVNLLGGGEAFWQLGEGGPPAPPARDRVVLNQPLADELQVGVGDDVIVRLPDPAEVPADSPLGRKTETVRSRRVTVAAVIAPQGLGRFSLRSSQQLPLNAYLATETLQAALSEPDRINALLVSGPMRDRVPAEADAAEAWLAANLRPTLADYGLEIRTADRGYWQLTSRRLLIEPAVERVALDPAAAQDPQPVLAYLANTIAVGPREIPYATVAGLNISARPPLGPLLDASGKAVPPLGDDEIALGSWAAEQLGARVGDQVRLDYFQPESTHGQIREQSVQLRLAAVLPLEGAAADRQLVPEVEGVTDQASIADWNPPFPFDAARIRQADEDYWDRYRATPKAFVSLTTARRLWGSRFGDATSIRYPPGQGSAPEALAARLRLFPADLGFQFRPVRRWGLEAATGTTPFSVLFLSFSMFLIAAALLLVGILFQLGIDTRAEQIGTLTALGYRAGRVRRALLAEGMLVALLGALFGVAGGVGYAWTMLAGLRTWWLAAVRTPFLMLYVTPTSLVLGLLLGCLASGLAMAWSLRGLRRLSVRQLLAGSTSTGGLAGNARPWTLWAASGGLLTTVALAVAGTGQTGPAEAGTFFVAGALGLASLLGLLWWRWNRTSLRSSITAQRWPILRLAMRNGARYPRRSLATMGLMALATFLIVAVSAFRLTPDDAAQQLGGGTGGMALWAESDQPIYFDWNTPEGRAELGFADQDAALLNSSRAFPLRVHAGDDASCLNLYQPREPRVLGVSPALIERGGFSFAASAAQTPAEQANPWLLLELSKTAPTAAPEQGRSPGPVACVIDQNTAMYSLHLYGGVGSRLTVGNGRGGKVELQVVGLLAGSILQGDVLVGEADFRRVFPDESGYRAFLIEASPGEREALAGLLENRLGDFGFDAQSASARLAEFQAVQNTYLSTFQSLGGLGLVLGTIGLAAVELRAVFERRGELALLRATGFRRRRLAALVLWENICLLAGGLGIGLGAALLAVLPHLARQAAALPWAGLGLTLALCAMLGLLAAAVAVRAALRTPLIAALRGD